MLTLRCLNFIIAVNLLLLNTIHGQIVFPSDSPGSSFPPARPPPIAPFPTSTRPPPQNDVCPVNSVCQHLGSCFEVIREIRRRPSSLRDFLCGFRPSGILVCCPSFSARPTPFFNTTPRPQFFTRPTTTTRRPFTPRPGSGIFFPGSEREVITTRKPTPRPTPPPPPPISPRPGSQSGKNLLPRDCGRQRQDDRIHGGTPAPYGAYSWIVPLGYTNLGSNEIQFECAGTVINNRYILTAAHCLDPKELGGRQLKIIHLGDWDLSSARDCVSRLGSTPECFPPHTVAGFEEVILHPNYNTRAASSDDIALIRLNITIDFNNLNAAPVEPICLPPSNLNAERVAQGRPAIATGWGFTEHGNRSNILLRVGLPFSNKQVCRDRYKERFVGNQLCVGGVAGLDTCSGDSGGPLVLSGPTGGPYLLIGIVSYGPFPCALANTPAVYTDVAPYRSWIIENLRP